MYMHIYIYIYIYVGRDNTELDYMGRTLPLPYSAQPKSFRTRLATLWEEGGPLFHLHRSQW